MLIVYTKPAHGWAPINHMVSLAKESFDAELLEVYDPASKLKQYKSVLLHRGNSTLDDTCLVICTGPGDLASILQVKNWRKRFRNITAWVIDSFWTNWTPPFLQYSALYDDIYITSSADIAEYRHKTKARIHYLPWGSDVLGLGSGGGQRPADLLRVGRQPSEWDDDGITRQCCAGMNIRFSGRPPFSDNPENEQAELMKAYSTTKYLLAFSNLSSPAVYTHPTKEYITGRWVDALACGAVVAGISPKKDCETFWEGATLELETTARENGLDIISAALEIWTPQIAAVNHLRALKNLDWRWRFKEIAETMGEKTTNLQKDLVALQGRIDSLSGEATILSMANL